MGLGLGACGLGFSKGLGSRASGLGLGDEGLVGSVLDLRFRMVCFVVFLFG